LQDTQLITLVNFKEYKGIDYSQVADEILQFWKENQIFERSVSLREGAPTFTFYEGPPSANGTPGIHHVMARTIKDIFCRFHTLRGKQVKRKGGWDTHGLPVELQVEKELGITKDDIGRKISVEEYNQKCRETVMRFTDQWNDLTERMGYWVDLQNPYVTYENNYIESCWWLLKQLYTKGLLYKGYTVQPYSPAAGTGLSSHELNMPGTYKDVKDTSVVAIFKAIRSDKSAFLFEVEGVVGDVCFLAWTTTPWTLPANCGLTVGEKIDYVQIRTFNPYTYQPVTLIMAKALVSKYFGEKGQEASFDDYQGGDKVIPWRILQEMKGRALLEIRYEQLIPAVTNHELETNAFRVIAGDFVTTEDGTGIVHTASVFGADDFRVCQQNGVPSVMVKDETGKDVPVVDRKGKFVREVGSYLVQKVTEHGIKTHRALGEDDFYVKNYLSEDEKQPDYKTTDEIIAIMLKVENKAFRVERYEHTYPHCWRTDKPVLYYPLDSWFIRTTAVKDKLIGLNNTINWQPASTGTGRFGNWLENLVDWNLSRSRFWGTPLPIWRSDDGEEVCIGSVEELLNGVKHALKDEVLTAPQRAQNEAFVQAVSDGKFDLHRPYVDEVYLVSASGKVMQRETDLIDVWFDSGAMPYAQWHYPFENQDIFEQSFPADFISEGVDQTRGWFFTLHAISTMVSESVSFKNVVSTGLVLDKNGDKMSKRKGNVINPFEALPQYGIDPIRWYMITNAEPWDNLRFNLDGITEVQRKFFGTLFNTYNFFALYANLDGYQLKEFDRVPYNQLPELDRWILSKLNSLIAEVTEQFEDYNPTKAGRAIQDFVCDQLSNWYVRLSRRRFWMGEMTQDKQAAYQTLQHCLVAVAQLMSPIAPFFADWLYKNMTDHVRTLAEAKQTPLRHPSVHLSDWQAVEVDWVDQDLETAMQLAQDICSLVHSLRKGHKIKVRQPLSKVLIPVLSAETRRQIEQVSPIIMAEVNVKSVEFLDDDSGILKKKTKPNFKALGPKFGPQMKDVAAKIVAMTADEIKALETNGSLTIGEIEIQLTDVEILTEDIPGWLVATDYGITVALDVTITDELRQEGIARDVVNRIQNLRKDSGLEVTDKIRIHILRNNDTLAEAILANEAYICTETQALSLQLADQVADATEIEMDEYQLLVNIEVAKA
jgi:isoleucyl-tRNA synthetase